jgi:hypothetical protein
MIGRHDADVSYNGRDAIGIETKEVEKRHRRRDR